ncbi:MAG: lamin tail domain-containing protein [bacterium]
MKAFNLYSCLLIGSVLLLVTSFPAVSLAAPGELEQDWWFFPPLSETRVSAPVEILQEQNLQNLKLTEIMYHPPAEGQYTSNDLEFLEFKNVGTETVDLSGLQFIRGLTYAFPFGRKLEPGEFFILSFNPFAFQDKYGSLPDGFAEAGALDNAGERLTIVNFNGDEVIDVEYDDEAPWSTVADGFGFSLVPVDPNPTGDQNDPFLWRASSNVGGSPRADDPPLNIPAILVNEVLADPEGDEQVDAIELYNPTGEAVDISNWYLTDDRREPQKYRIPADTIIPAGGYLVFTAEQFNANPGEPTNFGLSADGEQAYLFSANAEGLLTGYAHGVEFEVSQNGVSFGRYLNSVGDEHFPRMTTQTFGGPNAQPIVGPLVFSEIMYHPVQGGNEFVEIVNITNEPVNLYDGNHPENTWQINGLSFLFPPDIVIPPQGIVVVTDTNPAEFRSKYNVPASVQVFGPYEGALQNDGENLEILKPSNPLEDGTIPYMVVEAVRYNDNPPWPEEADGLGYSLERTATNIYGNDPIAWVASSQLGGTPGVAEIQTPVKDWVLY